MNAAGLWQVVLFVLVLLVLVKPLGSYMARVYQGERTFLQPVLRPIERLTYRLVGTTEDSETSWKVYAVAFLLFNLTGFAFLYAVLRLQAYLPLNPERLGAVPPDLAFNTAASFVSNTNWQNYGGEISLSYFTQMVGLTVQNFVSAGSGMAVLMALIRGLARRTSQVVGDFWVDLTRSVLYILLPLSLVLALALVSQGVVQTLEPYRQVALVEPVAGADGNIMTTQELALGPAASQIAIKQLGTNGGGFFNTNSAHPFENPTALSNFLECLAILVIPAALCYTFGKMVGDTRQGWAVFAAMTVLFVVMLAVGLWAEAGGNPALAASGADQTPGLSQEGGNMEGKEVRFGPANSVLWAVATTAASNGSVNSMHDSLMPLTGLVPMWMMQVGEVVFGGVGSGLYGMLAFVIVAVFVAGLMVGRTPEYLGKKIEAFEMKMASLVILIPPVTVLIGTALAVVLRSGASAVANPGPHGFSEILYAFSSAGNNNGSAFAGLSGNNPFYNISLGLAMLVGRYALAVPVLAIAGSLAGKKKVPVAEGTMPTHTPLFVAWVIGVVVIVGALSFLPALALGPVVEQLTMFAR